MSEGKSLFGDYHEMADIWARIKSVQSTLSHQQSPPERMQSQHNYGSFL